MDIENLIIVARFAFVLVQKFEAVLVNGNRPRTRQPLGPESRNAPRRGALRDSGPSGCEGD